MKWKPYGDQILVRALLPVEKTSGGLVIPDDARKRPMRGVVLAVGPGLPGELSGVPRAMACQEGDLVLFGEFAGMPEDLDGQPVLIMRDQEALAGMPKGDYELVEHDIRGRVVIHMASESCEECPKPAAVPPVEEPKSDVIAEERARLVSQSNAVFES